MSLKRFLSNYAPFDSLAKEMILSTCLRPLTERLVYRENSDFPYFAYFMEYRNCEKILGHVVRR